MKTTTLRTLSIATLFTLTAGAVVACPGAARGRLSPEARAERRARHWDAMTSKLDRNQDGAIARSEFLAKAEAFEKLDRNEDGVLSAADRPDDASGRSHEGGRGRLARRAFVKADADADGKVTRSEWDAARTKHFEKLDADSDGEITRDEFLAPPSRAEGA